MRIHHGGFQKNLKERVAYRAAKRQRMLKLDKIPPGLWGIDNRWRQPNHDW